MSNQLSRRTLKATPPAKLIVFVELRLQKLLYTNPIKQARPLSNGSYNSPIIIDSSGSDEEQSNDEDYEELYDGYQVEWNTDVGD